MFGLSMKLQGIEASYLAYAYSGGGGGGQTETSEPYLMLTYISWFTALEKCSVTALTSLSQ